MEIEDSLKWVECFSRRWILLSSSLLTTKKKDACLKIEWS